MMTKAEERVKKEKKESKYTETRLAMTFGVMHVSPSGSTSHTATDVHARASRHEL
jgi:hypothetical protein